MNSKPIPGILWATIHKRPETDCACSTTSFLPGDGLNTTAALWQHPPDLYYDSLPRIQDLVFNPLGPAGVVVLDEPARDILNSFAAPQPLANTTARQLAALGLLQPQNVPQSLPRPQEDMLTAWLHVTNACNLRCTYCYLHKTDEAMAEATGQAALEAIFRSAAQHDFQTVKLKYAGGEATLNFPLVRVLHQHAQNLAGQSNLELREVVLSNGVALNRQALDFIHAAGLRLMISLDGLGAAHDAQRPFVNGQGSSTLVARGIERALERGIKPQLSITVTGQNTAGAVEAVRFALDRGLLFNLNFYRDNDYAPRRDELPAAEERLIAGMRAIFALIEAQLPRQSLVTALVDRSNFGGLHQHACGAGHNYLVIDQHGGIARCHMEIERSLAGIFTEDPLAAIKTETSGFQNVPVDEKEECRNCEWRYWCAGGCPLLTYRTTGRNDGKSPYCNVYKTLYPELLRLEGLRLLKWPPQIYSH